MKLSSLLIGIVFAGVVIAVLLLVLGVRFHSTTTSLQGAALYNPANEVTVKGVVTAVDEFDCPVSEGELGLHLTLKTADETLQVHLGPSRILQGQKLGFAPGDQLQVVGARVELYGKNGLIAQEITRGNESFILRDHDGKLLMVQ